MTYKVMSPRGETDDIEVTGLQPRVADLNGKTIGLYATFKEHWMMILNEIGKQLQERYPDIKLTRFRYTKDLNSYTQVAEVAKDPEVRPEFEEWVKGVDLVITANGDAGSCALYLTYNTALVEHLGKPVVMMANHRFETISKSAASLRGVKNLRTVTWDLGDLSMEPDLEYAVNELIPGKVSEYMPQIIAALTSPLTPEEDKPQEQAENPPRIVYEGDIQEVNQFYYQKGWAYGMPVMPPTEEAVKEMMSGTDLPPDHVVAKIPPMMGRATVETIAVNAVMAGCLPTYMPVLIAAVEAMVDPRMWIEAYTCSAASWAPLLIVNGPVRNDLDLNSGGSIMSPYYKANAAIAHAVGLIIMNIAGIRVGIEDMGIFGHEGRFGMCFAENEEESPWEPMHVYYGFEKEDSAITMSWPHLRMLGMYPENLDAMLTGICEGVQAHGFDPGCTFILLPETAKFLADNGFSRRDFVDYLVEYARKPATQMNVRWMKGNNHIPKNVPLPADPTRSVRKFLSGMHMPVAVAGMSFCMGIAFYSGGGDHGGPITKKINLPKNWNELVEKYRSIKLPEFK